MRKLIHLIAIVLVLAGIYLAYVMIYVDNKYTSDEMFDAVNAHRKYIGIQTLEKDPTLCENLEERWRAVIEPENNSSFVEWLEEKGLIKNGKAIPPYNLIGDIFTNASTPSNALVNFEASLDQKAVLERAEFNVGCAYANEGTTVIIMAEKTK
jgi:hypothetical protein